jgi:hypothetical protein
MVSWNTITQPKECGGLGLRNLQSMNEACLMKLGWSLMSEEYSLWGQVLIGKYGRSGWSQGDFTVTSNDSPLWKAIAKSWTKLEAHRYWSIGDGNKPNFWTGKWIDGSTRISDFMQEIPEGTRRWKVKDVASTTGEWNFGLIQDLVPSSIVQKMHAVVPPNTSHEEDVMLWPGTNTGQFTVAAAYHLIAGDISNNVDKKWHQIWKLDSMERIRVFIWLLVHNRLQTKARLARWQLGNSFCDRCTQFDETTLHVVRDCPTAVNIWRHLLSSPQERGIFFVVEFHEWINLNLTNKFGRRYGNDWKEIWATACFLLW